MEQVILVAGDEVGRVRELLVGRFAEDVGEVRLLGSGEFSRAFAFVAGGKDFVVRVNGAVHAAESFAKDEYAWRHFASRRLPIPRVVMIGQEGEGYFAISERAAGRVMTELDPAERRALLPGLLVALEAIGAVDVRGARGFGDWDGEGKGKFGSWREYLAAVMEDESEGYYKNWHAMFEDGSLERGVFEAVYRHMLALLDQCPEERGLIHNDYWFMNIVGEGARITGVIDWANALYGDPLYDIARLSWGSAWPGWWYADGAAFLRERYGALPGYDARLACYSCHFGLDDLRFYAKTGRRAEYAWARERLVRLVTSNE
ncbi:MAG: aminoglycoside phosphotransferase family protein [Chloroflexia bacterium]